MAGERRAVWVLGVWASVGCSLITDYPLNNLPCEHNDTTGLFACTSGYTCGPGSVTDKVCILDHTREVGDGCYSDQQCVEGALCPNNTCLEACANAEIYLPTSNCPLNALCAPFASVHAYVDGQTHTPNLVAACRTSDSCQAGSACTLASGQAGGICVGISNTSVACLPGCQPQYNAANYSDNCSTGLSCVPVGNTLQQQTVCVRNDIHALPVGSACTNSVGTPCVAGAFCAQGICSKWCEPTQTAGSQLCDATQRCCPFTLNSTAAGMGGFCATTCP